ncbi:hypothetical protein [Burkholderia sp. 22PA0106]|uniref:hypothetical protein n=1 Tax=Burkholderia sp. 22PA0106 TaxID=3237371 RepID=UPI0039C1A607
MLDRWLKRLAPRGECRLTVSREAVTVRRTGASRHAAAQFVERPLMGAGFAGDAAPGALAAALAAAIDESGGRGLPVHVCFADALARYFMVTPAENARRLSDLRAAAEVRFRMLYGQDPAGWQIQADWQAAEPFLACAVPRYWAGALHEAVAAGRGCVVSAQPEFVAAWNETRRELGAHTWLATRGERALTLGLIAAAPRARVVAVRTLAVPEPVPSLGWLREQVTRAALLDNLPAPSALVLHGPRCEVWMPGATDFTDPGLAVRWAGVAERANALPAGAVAESAAPLAWSAPTQ